MSQNKIVGLGETMLRMETLTPGPLLSSNDFRSYVGGSESNTLTALSQLGHHCQWLSRLPDHALGYRILHDLRASGIDVSQVASAPAHERVGLFYVDRGAPPLSDKILYDRADSAAAKMLPTDLPLNYFRPNTKALLHTTGITIGADKCLRNTAYSAWQQSGDAHWLRSFDFNYRAALWPIQTAWSKCLPLLQSADLVLISSRDLHTLWGSDDPLAQLQQLRDTCPTATLAVTLGGQGALGSLSGQAPVHSPSKVQCQLGRIGRGDAFGAGFIHAWLNDPMDIQTALDTANACSALKSSSPSDTIELGPALQKTLKSIMENSTERVEIQR